MEPVGSEASEGQLAPLRVAIVKHAHTPTGGAEDELFHYLQRRVSECAMLAHPFPDARGVPPYSRWTRHRRAGSPEEQFGWRGRGPDLVFYVRDVLETLRRFLPRRHRWDVYVGVDNLNAALGVLLRWLGCVRAVIFYVIDYVPQRFESALLNRVYHALDAFAVRHADVVWNVGGAMQRARAERGLAGDALAPQLTVPVGAPTVDTSATKSSDPLVAFLGHLSPEQGLDLLLRAWADVLTRIPAARLRIVGSGPEHEGLRTLAQELNVHDSLDWCGFVGEAELPTALGEAWIGVAPYAPTNTTYKSYADPGKLRWYCAVGLPIVVTTVPAVAETFAEAEAALCVEPDTAALAEGLIRLMRDPALRQVMGDAARRMAEEFTWCAIFDRAWAESWPHLERRWGQG